MARLVVIHDFDGEYAILRRPCKLAISPHRLDLILLHQEFETFSVLRYDLRFTILHRSPVQFARVHALDSKFLGIFEMVPEFSVEQQGLGRNAAHVQTGASQKSVFFDECGFQTPLSRANGSGVPGRSAADDSDVKNSFRQSNNTLVGRDDKRQTNDSRTGATEWQRCCAEPENGSRIRGSGYELRFGCALAASGSVLLHRRDHLEHSPRGDSSAVDSAADTPVEPRRRKGSLKAIDAEEVHILGRCLSVGLGLLLGPYPLRLPERP